MEFEVFSEDAAGMLTGISDLGGGNWGSNMVYNQFITFLYKVFGKSAIDGLNKSNSYDLLEQFTIKMRFVRPVVDEHERINMMIPADLWARRHTEQALLSDIQFCGGKIRFTHKNMLEFHRESLQTIGNHLAKIFSMPAHKDISTVIMLGEYAKSRILQDYIARRFSSKKMIVPIFSEHLHQALLKGAIHYGIRKTNLV